MKDIDNGDQKILKKLRQNENRQYLIMKQNPMKENGEQEILHKKWKELIL